MCFFLYQSSDNLYLWSNLTKCRLHAIRTKHNPGFTIFVIILNNGRALYNYKCILLHELWQGPNRKVWKNLIQILMRSAFCLLRKPQYGWRPYICIVVLFIKTAPKDRVRYTSNIFFPNALLFLFKTAQHLKPRSSRNGWQKYILNFYHVYVVLSKILIQKLLTARIEGCN